MGALHSQINAVKEATVGEDVKAETNRLNALVELATAKKKEFALTLKLARGPDAPEMLKEITGGRTFMRHSQVYAATSEGLDQGITDALDDFFTAIDQTVPKNTAKAYSTHKAAYQDAVRQRDANAGCPTLPAPNAAFKDYGVPIPSPQFDSAVDDPMHMPQSDVISATHPDGGNLTVTLKNDIRVTTDDYVIIHYSDKDGKDQVSEPVQVGTYKTDDTIQLQIAFTVPASSGQSAGAGDANPLYYTVIKSAGPNAPKPGSYALAKWTDYRTKRWDEVVSFYAALRDKDSDGSEAAQHSAVSGTKKLITTAVSALVGTSKGSSNEIQDFFVMYVNGGFCRIDYCVYSYSIDAKSFGFERTESIVVTYSEAAILNHNDLKMDEQRFLMNQCVNRATQAEVTAMTDATLTTKSMLASNYNWPKPAIPDDTMYFLPDTPNPPTRVIEQADNEQDPQSGNGQKK